MSDHAVQPSLLPEADGTLTVGEVGRRVELAIRRELGGKVWVRGEIHGKRRNANGHVFFDLVGDGCKLPVVLWSADRHAVNHALKRTGNAVAMEDGTEVRIRCEVQWHRPTGRVQLRMDRIDPAFTLGQLAARREVLLRQLASEGLLRAQAALPMPDVPLRVGLVTSVGSAAHGDVVRTLAGSRLGWRVVECDARVQGPGAETSLGDAIRGVVAAGVDVVVLARGGGARTDLAAFDSETLARTIAAAPVPVLSGVGHEVDTSVADAVAWARHVTPTACAEWLVTRVRGWCDRRDATWSGCVRAATVAIDRSTRRIDRTGAGIAAAARQQLRHSAVRLGTADERLARRPDQTLAAAETALQHRVARLAALDPARVLARGWSITRTAEGRLVRSPGDVSPGDVLSTTTAGGPLRSRVEDEDGRSSG
jgi:exodeoxyribonuclease VII large subunit